jgi:hypothetical protein
MAKSPSPREKTKSGKKKGRKFAGGEAILCDLGLSKCCPRFCDGDQHEKMS